MRPAARRVLPVHSDLVGVRALPLLQGLADFDRIDGKLQAKLARSAGTSQRALMANMQGTAFVSFQDGAIRGINVAQMIRSLTSGTLSGWQDSRSRAPTCRSSPPPSASTRARP